MRPVIDGITRNIRYPIYLASAPSSDPIAEVDGIIEAAWPKYIDTASPDTVEHLMHARSAHKRAGAYGISSLIQHRQILTVTAQQQLDERLAKLKDELPKLHSRIPILSDEPANSHDDYRRFDQIQKQIADLERQQQEILRNQWRDTLPLKQDLIQQRLDERTASQRLQMLAGDDGGNFGE